jgi:hypothetical protein
MFNSNHKKMSKENLPRFTVHVTNDYSVFKLPDYQRAVAEGSVKKIMSSIKKDGQIQALTVDKSGNIVDGQHRLEALKRLKLPVWYCINHNLDKKEESSQACKSANNVSRKWNLMAYVNWAKKNGNEVIAEAEAIARDWSKTTNGELTIASALELLNSASLQDAKSDLDQLTYKMNYDVAKNVFDFADFLKDYTVGTPFCSRMVRPLKKLSLEKGGLDIRVAKKMCKRKHIRIFASQGENYNFIKELYEKYE